MAKYQLLTGKHGRDEEVYYAGQVMELTKEEAEGNSLKGRIRPIADDDGVDISLMNATAAVAFVNSLETVEELVDFKTAEEDGKSRKTVLTAIDERVAELASE